MKTLIINTYAGSLLLGADALAGSGIVGSFEDSGFGSVNTKANRARFQNLEPDFTFVDHLRDWPDLDLTSCVVLAHPPCAAFSQQNTSAAKRGVDTDAFDCTRKVLHYAMSHNAAAIAVESVMGAMAGAWDVHDKFGQDGGYHVYRVLKNSILFGVPQFRERFWVLFVRQGLADERITLRLAPRVVTIGGVLDALETNTPLENLDKTVTKFVMKLVNEHGFDEARVREVGLADVSGVHRKGFATLLQPVFFPNLERRFVLRNYVSPFTSAQPSVLAPGGFAPVLLGSSLWIYHGAPVSTEGYRAIMGFPTDYVFPPDGHGMRTYLSKGVCPPVATWILDSLRTHLGESRGSSFTAAGGYEKTVQPGSIASFRPSRKAIIDRLEAMHELGQVESDELIDLRNEEEELEDED